MTPMLRIARAELRHQTEPFARPFAFKGASFRKKLNALVRLTSSSRLRLSESSPPGIRATHAFGIGGLAPLWADAGVFLNHGEDAANALMLDILRFALGRAVGEHADPPALLAALLPDVHAYAVTLTGRAALSRTFTLNALVALDFAAWVLYARQNNLTSFDDLIPPASQPAMAHRHRAVAAAPLVNYTLPDAAIAAMLDAGVTVMKIKLGQSGDEAAMLEKDLARLTAIHNLAHRHEGVHYYLDINSRYTRKETLLRLLDHPAAPRVILIEEPFDPALDIDVTDIPARLAVDESLHDVADLPPRVQQGYRAMAIKPAGKTLSVAFDMAAAARQHNLGAFVADNACVPTLVDWNKTFAARLAPLAPLDTGLLESNGPDTYAHWPAMLQHVTHPDATWLTPREGCFHLGTTFHETSAAVFDDPPVCIAAFAEDFG